jgi:predicted porin
MHTKREAEAGLGTWLVLAGLALMPPQAAAASEQSASENPPAAPEAVTTEEARERERESAEDALAKNREQSVDAPRKWEDRPNELKPYLSLRPRFRVEDGQQVWGDSGSRVGVEGRYQYRPSLWAIGTAEVGIRLLSRLDQALNPSSQAPERQLGDELYLRLLYVGAETHNAAVTFGKNWSAYYQVSRFTDLFQGNGASASGTFNAGTDGGETGTGRADRVLQGRFLITPPAGWLGLRPFQFNIQAQYDEPVPGVPGANYGAGVGASAIADWWPGYSVGLAYNRAVVRNQDAAVLRAAGIDGDAQAMLIGARWLSGRWHVATTVARLLNQQATDQGVYFDGWGWEAYAQYQATRHIFLVGGWNYLRPDATQKQAGPYDVKYAVLEVRYTFRDFTRMIYASVRLDDSTASDGRPAPNVYTVGVRWEWP